MNQIKMINIPKPRIPATDDVTGRLPFNGKVIADDSFVFSFSCFDRSHDLFNLGANTSDGVISGSWFIDLMDCLKSVSNFRIPDLKGGIHDLHPVDWDSANTRKPDNTEQLEFWQFRLNKSKGRVVGIKIDSVFYVVWLDPHHNLCDSEGYGTVTKFRAPMSEYDKWQLERQMLIDEANHWQDEYDALCELNEETKGLKSR